MAKIFTLACFLTLFSISQASALSNLDQYLREVHSSLANKSVQLVFAETYNKYEHSYSPWQYVSYERQGTIVCSMDNWNYQDSLKTRNNNWYQSQTCFSEGKISRINYGDSTVLDSISTDEYNDYLVSTARYSGFFLMNYIYSYCEYSTSSIAKQDLIIAQLGSTQISIFLNNTSLSIDSIVTSSYDELYGDVAKIFKYFYTKSNKVKFCPTRVIISKYNGAMVDSVQNMNQFNGLSSELPLSNIGWTQNYDKVPQQTEVSWSNYSPGIYLLEMHHTDDRVLIVEFDEYVLVAEAPINSRNGQLIIEEVSKRLQKPISYFVYGHFHPHYLGGVRPFVHIGAQIISAEPSKDYVRFLVENEHSLDPDSLYFSQNPLIQKVVEDSLILEDNTMKMVVYFIGGESAHTSDYMIYYFPNQKLLFEDDLVWIKLNNPTVKAGSRQSGLYNAIEKRGLNVETIIQSWPVKDYGVKTIFSFAELKATIKNEE